MSLQLASVLHLWHLNKSFKFSVLQYPTYDTGIATLPQFPFSALSIQPVRCLAHGLISQCLITTFQFDGDVWLTHVIDANNASQRCFTQAFPVWSGFTASDHKWQTQCYPLIPSPHNLWVRFLFFCWTVLACS